MTLPGLDHPDDTGRLRRLQEHLAERAEASGALDVAYRTLDSPLGPLLVAATQVGVVRIAFATETTDVVLRELASRVSPVVLAAPRRLDAVARQLEEYLQARRHTFDIPLDLQLVRGFRRQVVERLGTIGYGEVASYRDLALAVGNPGASRAVGTACATNPLPLLLPCHRVVRADGGTGQYRGGAQAKVWLLSMEREHVA